MALGYEQALLLHSKAVFMGTAPSTKITPPGYLTKVAKTKANIVSKGIDNGSGHIKDVKIKYRTRGVAGQSSDSDNCDIDVRPVYSEATVDQTLFRKIGIHIDDDTIRRYSEEASRYVTTVNGQPALASVSSIMQDHFDAILEQMNGLLQDINDDLLDKQNTLWGKNQVTGLTTTTALNFPLTTTTPGSLTTGMTKLMADIMANEIRIEDCEIVGSGLINNYFLQQRAKGLDNNGLNTALLAMPTFYNDYGAASAWGANRFGVFEKNAVQFIDVIRFAGNFSGWKGGSYFGVLPVNLIDSMGNPIAMTFDMQLKYYDCPTEVNVAGYDEPQTINRGWVLTPSKSFDQFNIPGDAYASSDRLTGNNGTLLYTASNS